MLNIYIIYVGPGGVMVKFKGDGQFDDVLRLTLYYTGWHVHNLHIFECHDCHVILKIYEVEFVIFYVCPQLQSHTLYLTRERPLWFVAFEHNYVCTFDFYWIPFISSSFAVISI